MIVPTFVDEQSLPRLHAFISEVHRWRPIAPEGRYPHILIISFVPKGYNVYINTVGVAHRVTEDVIWVSNL